MKNQSLIAKFYPHILGLFSAVFVLIPHFTTMAILAWVAFLILAGVLKAVRFSWNWKMALWIGFYLIYLIGVLFTDHTDIAGKYLEYKLSFVILPLLFSFQPKLKYEKSIIFLWFIVALTGLTILGFYHGFKCGLSANCFTSSEFSYIHHPTYFSAFHVLAFTAAIIGYKRNWKYFNLRWVIPFGVFSIMAQLLSLSLAGILFLGILSLTYFLLVLYRKWNITGLLVGSVVFPLIFFGLINATPQIESQWTVAKFYANEFASSPKKFIKKRQYPYSGTEVRLVMWTAAFQTFQKHPLGVGTGNVDDYLGAQLISLNQSELAKQNYNPHNQFLQVGIEIGIFGLLYILGMLFYFFRYSWQKRDYILLILTASLFFNSLFESMLQRQSGIVFYTFFICILLLMKDIKSPSKNQISN